MADYKYGVSLLDEEEKEKDQFEYRPGIPLYEQYENQEGTQERKEAGFTGERLLEWFGATARNIPDQARASWAGLKQANLENAIKEYKGDAPPSWMLTGPGMFGASEMAVATMERKLAFESMPEEKLNALNEDILSTYEQNYKDYEKYANQAAKRLEQFGPKAKAASAGFSSFMVQAPLLVGAAYSRNPLVAQAALPAFGMMEKGTSYMEGRKSGLSHEEASVSSTINAISEVGTEGLSNIFMTRGLFKSFDGQGKDLWEKTLNVLKNGAKSTVVETGTEELNMVIQNLNGLLFDVQSELKQAYEGQSDPLYSGPTPAEVWADQFFLTAIASVVGSGSNTTLAGGFTLAPDIKNELLKLDPDKSRVLARNLKTLIDNTEFSSLALDEAVIRLYNPETYDPNVVNPIDWMTESYLEADLEAIPGQTRSGIPIEEGQEDETQFQPQFSFSAPADVGRGEKSLGPKSQEINKVSFPGGYKVHQEKVAMFSDFEASPVNINMEHSQQDLSSFQQQFLLPRSFNLEYYMSDEFLSQYKPEDRERIKNIFDGFRDFESQEQTTISKAFNLLNDAGMPSSVLNELKFIGVHGTSPALTKKESEMVAGMYGPDFNSITIPQYGLDEFNNSSSIASIASTISHELGHHLDYSFVPKVGDEYRFKSGKLMPISMISPLFSMGKPTIVSRTPSELSAIRERLTGTGVSEGIIDFAMERKKEYIAFDGPKGSILTEAFEMYAPFHYGRLEDGTIESHKRTHANDGDHLKYPMSMYKSDLRTIAAINKMKNPQESVKAVANAKMNFIKSEVFAQMHNLYYTNRPLLEEKAPEAFKLIERIYDGISVDGIRNQSIGIFSAFRAPSPSGSIQVNSRRGTTDPGQPRSPEEPARSTMEAESVANNRDDLRQPIPIIEQKDSYVVPVNKPRLIKNQYPGAPNKKGSKTARTLLINKMVKFAEDPLSMVDTSRYWYDDALSQVEELTRGNEELKDNTLKMLAVYSSQTPLDANVAYVLRSLVSMAKGEGTIKGFGPNTARDAQLAMDNKGEFGAELPGVGLKLQSFYQNLSGKDTDAVTIDSWMLKLLGYPTNATSPSIYAYAQDVIQETTKKYNSKNNSDLSPMQMQAVLWTYARNKQLQEQGKQPDYADFNRIFDRATALVTGEVIPTPQIADLAFVEELTQEQKVQLSRDLLEAFTTENNTFELLDVIDTTGLYSFSHSFGGFKGAVNPNILTKLTLEKISGEKQFDANDLSTADDFIRAWGYVFRQNAMPWQLADDTLTDAEADDLNNYNAFRGSDIEFNVEGQSFELTDISRDQIAAALNEQGITGWSQTGPSSINVINFDQIDGFTDKVVAAFEGLAIEGLEVNAEHEVKYRTQYLENNWNEQKNGESYLENSRLNEPSIQEGLDNLRAKADEVYAQYRFKAGQESSDPNPDLPASGIELSDPANQLIQGKTGLYETIYQWGDNGNPGVFFRGEGPGGKSGASIGALGDGIYLTWEQGMAEAFAGLSGTEGVVRKYKVKEGLKIAQEGSEDLTNARQQLGFGETEYSGDPGYAKALKSLLEAKGYDGAISPDGATGLVIFDPKNITLVEDKISLTEPSFSKQGPDENNQWTMGDEGVVDLALQSFRTVIANNFDRVVVMQNRVENQYDSAADYRITDYTDVIHGKIKDRLDKSEAEVDATLKKIVDRKITLDELNDFMRNLHAPERNEYINSLREPGKPGSKKYKDKGSGISTDDAIQNLRNYGINYINGSAVPFTEKGQILLESFKDVQKVIQGTLDIYSQDGLVEEGTVEDWSSRYNYYVPLVGFASDTTVNQTPSITGKGMTLYGPELKKAKGRESISGPPIEQIMHQRINAIVRSEKNQVGVAFAEFAREFPNPEMYEVMEEAPQIKPKLANWNNIDGEAFVGFKEDGVQKYIRIYDERLANAFHTWGSSEMSGLVRFFAPMSRFMSMMATQYNLDFIPTNFTRDIQTAYYNLLAEEIPGGRTHGVKISDKFLNPKKIKNRQRQLWRAERGKEISDPDIENIQEYYDVFKSSGAITGYIDQPTTERLTKNIKSMMEMHQGTFKGNFKKGAKPIISVIEDLNTAVENTARFHVFVEFLMANGGIEKATAKQINQAAVLSKNLTINFNKKGTLGGMLNSMFIFFNASIQGMSNFARGLQPGTKSFSGRKATAMGALAFFGSLRTYYNMMMSGEDDDDRLLYEKIPAHEKERNMIFMLPGIINGNEDVKVDRNKGGFTKYKTGEKTFAIAIPLPYLYNVFDAAGRLPTEMIYGTQVLDREIISPSEASMELASTFIGSASPVGLTHTNAPGLEGLRNITLKTGTPTVFKPLTESALNENWFGAPIAPEQTGFGPTIPKSNKRLKHTREFYIDFAKSLNEFSGGNDYRSGPLDLSPATMQYVAEYFGSGPLRLGTRTYDAIDKVMEGRDLSLQEVPIARIFTAEPEDYVDAKDYFNNSDEIDQLAFEYKGLMETDRAAAKILKDEKWDLIKLGPYKTEAQEKRFRSAAGRGWDSDFDRAEKALKEIRQKERDAYDRYYKQDPFKYAEKMDKYDKEKNKVYQRFNKRYYKAKEKIRNQ